MQRIWVIRGGEDTDLVDEFVDNGVVAVGYPQVPDGTTVAKADVVRLLKTDGGTVPRERAARFESFVREIEPGDVILMPDTPRGDIVIGEVTGAYEFHEEIDPESFRHRRPVEWKGRESVSALPESHRNLFKQRVTLKEASGEELDAFAAPALSGSATRSPTDHATKTTSRASKRIEPDDPRANDRLCPGCQLRKHPGQFEASSDLCTDCR